MDPRAVPETSGLSLLPLIFVNALIDYGQNHVPCDLGT